MLVAVKLHIYCEWANYKTLSILLQNLQNEHPEIRMDPLEKLSDQKPTINNPLDIPPEEQL